MPGKMGGGVVGKKMPMPGGRMAMMEKAMLKGGK
jgi:hypothetical protein